jgi:hypothetical protein
VTLVPAYAEIARKESSIAVIAKRDFVRAVHASENPGRELLIVRVGDRGYLGFVRLTPDISVFLATARFTRNRRTEKDCC